jgi:hypothetical protein
MKQLKTQSKLLFFCSFLGVFLLASCQTLPENFTHAYYLPQEGERHLYMKGNEADHLLKPMADSFGMDEYGKIEPILEETDRIYLVTKGDAIYIQGQGDYNAGFISFILGANRDWEKEKIGSFKAYRSVSTSMELIFPDERTFLLSQGNLTELLDLYQRGGSQSYPFTTEEEAAEALLLRVSLEGEDVLPMQSFLKTSLKMVEIGLNPLEGGNVSLDVILWGEENSGRLLGSALKLFFMASLGRSAMDIPLESGNDYARMNDVPVDFDFLINMIGN